MPVRLIHNHIEHHAAHSGYDLLARHVTATDYRDGLLYRLTRHIGSRRLARMAVRKTPWYSAEAQRREIAICARASLLPARTIFHWLYGENDVRLCSRWRLRWNNRFVASFHQPPEYLDGHVEDKTYIRGLDAAVVVAESQIEYMSRLLPRERIHCVPHGVDTDYWHRGDDDRRHAQPTFLFVGNWLRDFEMTKATIRRCRDQGISAHFRMVVPPERVDELRELPNTTVLTRIDDEDLRAEFRSAHALFLPLTLATANNSLLEAMACGTGVITTHTGGVPEYVTEECGTLVPPGDVAAAADAIARMCRDPAQAETIGQAARERALTFRWPRVGAQMDEVYRRILSRSRHSRGDTGRSSPPAPHNR